MSGHLSPLSLALASLGLLKRRLLGSRACRNCGWCEELTSAPASDGSGLLYTVACARHNATYLLEEAQAYCSAWAPEEVLRGRRS